MTLEKFCLLIILFVVFSSTCVQAQSPVPFRQGNQWGYADSTGNIIIEPKYDGAGLFREAKNAWVRKGDKYAYIKRNGELTTKFKFDKASDFYNGRASVRKKNKSFHIDSAGKKLKPVWYCEE